MIGRIRQIAGWPRRRLAVLLAAVLTVAAAAVWGLGNDDGGPSRPERASRLAAAPSRASYPKAPTMAFSGERFADAAPAGPGVLTRRTGHGVSIRVTGPAERRFVAATMPAAVPDPGRATLVTARVEIPRLGPSAAGVFCRGTTSDAALTDGYAFVVKRSGLWMLFRVRGDRHELLGRAFFPPAQVSPSGRATVVQLSCERHTASADQWFAVRANDSTTQIIRVRGAASGASPAPAGDQIGVVVMHMAQGGGTTVVRADALTLHMTP